MADHVLHETEHRVYNQDHPSTFEKLTDSHGRDMYRMNRGNHTPRTHQLHTDSEGSTYSDLPQYTHNQTGLGEGSTPANHGYHHNQLVHQHYHDNHANHVGYNHGYHHNNHLVHQQHYHGNHAMRVAHQMPQGIQHTGNHINYHGNQQGYYSTHLGSHTMHSNHLCNHGNYLQHHGHQHHCNHGVKEHKNGHMNAYHGNHGHFHGYHVHDGRSLVAGRRDSAVHCGRNHGSDRCEHSYYQDKHCHECNGSYGHCHTHMPTPKPKARDLSPPPPPVQTPVRQMECPVCASGGHSTEDQQCVSCDTLSKGLEDLKIPNVDDLSTVNLDRSRVKVVTTKQSRRGSSRVRQEVKVVRGPFTHYMEHHASLK